MTNLEHALEDCLTRLASGKARLEDCLAGYPEHAEELRRLLTAAAQVERGRAVSSPPDFKARTRARLVAHMAAHPRGPTVAPTVAPARAPHARSNVGLTRAPQFRPVFGLAALVALFLVAGTALAQNALPGSAGYGWKIASEHVWRFFQPDPLTADLALADRRAAELALVAGDPRARAIASQSYRQALEALSQYTLPASRQLIQAALVKQQRRLDQAGLAVPELNKLLTSAPSGLAPPEPTRALPTPLPIPTSPPTRSTPGSIKKTEPGAPTLSLPLPTVKPILPSD